MPYVTFNGLKYHYLANMPESPGQAVVFIHGSGGSCQHWHHQVAALGRDFLTLAVDLPGHGLSGGKPCDTIEDYREFVYSFAERVLGIPFFLAGHSMGGAVTLDFALSDPDMLAGLILIGTGSRLRVLPSILESFREGNVPENFTSFLYRQDTPEAVLKAAGEDMGKTGSAVFYSDLTACDRFDVSKRLGEIELPAIVITGEKDLMTPVKYGQYLGDHLNNAVFEVVEDSGHMTMLERPAAVNSLINDFMVKNKK
ncbi:MAG TPA: alpha/beta hydrolase [Desulfotomaculum sp.]|nr:alpha/beta hydrolase [Desulfotomaculum sp.]